MPQLDHVTYFSQYFWLCVVFFAFYGACVKYYLPGLSRLTKYRIKTQNQDDLSLKGGSSEIVDLKGRLSLPPVMENLLGASFNYSSFSENLKSLSSFASLKHIFAWRLSNCMHRNTVHERCAAAGGIVGPHAAHCENLIRSLSVRIGVETHRGSR